MVDGKYALLANYSFWLLFFLFTPRNVFFQKKKARKSADFIFFYLFKFDVSAPLRFLSYVL